jgi:hypothetical protein
MGMKYSITGGEKNIECHLEAMTVIQEKTL